MVWLVPLGTALTLALAPPASDPGPSTGQVGTMHLRLPNELSGPDQSTLQQRFEDGVSRSGLSAQRVPKKTSSCEEAACFQAAAQSAKVDLLMGGTIEHTGPDYAVEVYAISAETGEVVASVEGVCEICGVGELADSVGALAARLRPSLENATQPTTLTVDSDPSGASVYVDGKRVGSTPMQAPVAPGTHEIDVVKRGRRTQHVEVDLRSGVNESYSFRLARSTRVPVWVPWAAMAAGVGTLGAGIGLLVIDENQIQSDCNADVNGNCEFLYDTVTGGAVLTVAGVALIGTGVALMLAQRRQDRLQRSGIGARLRLTPGIGGATLSGRF